MRDLFLIQQDYLQNLIRELIIDRYLAINVPNSPVRVVLDNHLWIPLFPSERQPLRTQPFCYSMTEAITQEKSRVAYGYGETQSP